MKMLVDGKGTYMIDRVMWGVVGLDVDWESLRLGLRVLVEVNNMYRRV